MIRPFGESALLVDLGSPERAQALAASLRHDPLPGFIAAVPGLESVMVELDRLAAPGDAERIAERVARLDPRPIPGRRRTIPVVYGGEHGPDLPEVAALCGLSAADVVERHASAELHVLFLGFAPGFAYLGDLPPALRVPRLVTPRTTTPAGSVAVAEGMSGIYPAALPGGWRVIGRTPVALFDPRRDPPAYLAPGDTVHFRPISVDAWDDHSGVAEDW
ncbi:MAG: 5-oxoprolinase subunit PxpB [Chloroflexota bacterium]|nr:5-oxoprolinase subunit PxpB [Chloroflexota bacterium]